MKRILINGTQSEELRVALVDGQKLYNLDIELPAKEQKKSSIYKGKITRVEQSLEAAFVDFGANRHGFLPFKEISEKYYSEKAKKMEGKPRIKDAVSEGLEVIVQIEKEERANKGAALTTKISLAGRYLVLMPTEAKAGGVSRRIEGKERSEIRETLREVNQPEDMGCIVRTAGVGRSAEELQWDIDYLISIWKAIEAASKDKPAPFLIYQDSDLVVRALRDHYDSDIGEIIIDEEGTYKRASDFIQQVMPHNLRKLKLYDERTPLFNRFQVEGQIESAFHREVTLPSGGAIVIDQTEALTAIDVNSGRATKGGDIEETAFNTNLEAAEEMARQLRLRDLGGLFVLDFIDMYSRKNQRSVENRLKHALGPDRARVQVGRISRFGLLEMSRQRLRPSLGESSQELCPVCSGKGEIRSVESLSLSILRLIEEEASKESSGMVSAHVPIDVATYLLNEKREQIFTIEKRYNVSIILVPDENFDRPNYQIERMRSQDQNPHHYKRSHELVEKKETPTPTKVDHRQVEVAAVRSISPGSPAPVPLQPTQPGLVVRLWNNLFATGSEEKDKKKPAEKTRNTRGNTRKPSARKGDNQNRRKPQQKKPQQRKPRQGQQQNKNRKSKQQKNTGNTSQQNKTNKPQQQRRKTPTKKQSTSEGKPDQVKTQDKNQQQSDKKPAQKKSGPRRRGPGRRNTQAQKNINTEKPQNETSPEMKVEKQVQPEPRVKPEVKRAKPPVKPEAVKKVESKPDTAKKTDLKSDATQKTDTKPAKKTTATKAKKPGKSQVYTIQKKPVTDKVVKTKSKDTDTAKSGE